MNRRIFGAIFLAVGAALYASRFVCAAIYAGGMASQSHELFQLAYNFVGFGLTRLALVFFGLGAIYMVWGELESAGKHEQFATINAVYPNDETKSRARFLEARLSIILGDAGIEPATSSV